MLKILASQSTWDLGKFDLGVTEGSLTMGDGHSRESHLATAIMPLKILHIQSIWHSTLGFLVFESLDHITSTHEGIQMYSVVIGLCQSQGQQANRGLNRRILVA